MKTLYNLLRMTSVRVVLVLIVAAVGSFIFQASNPMGVDESNPLIDQPTAKAMTQFVPPQYNQYLTITDDQGFDNFQAGISWAEHTVAMNPRNPLWIFFGVNNAPQDAYYTTNGGLNWTLHNPSYVGGTCCDPWSAFDSLGRLFYASGVSGQYVYTSTDNGITWGSGVLSVSGNDRNTIAADQTAGPYANYLYAAETPGNFARSTNSNVSWTQTFTSSNTVPGTMIAVGPNGAVQGGCVIYVTNTGSTVPVTYNFHRSTDGGATFTPNISSISDAGYVGTLNGAGRLVINNGRTRPYPMIAMDNSYGTYRGRLYLVYASNNPPGNGNKPDIILRYSTDQGSTWSARITVNDDANSTTIDNWFPGVWCEKETGKLYIMWYDDRNAPSTYGVDVYATYSTTGGTTFAPNQRLTNATWTYPCPSCAPNTNCYMGDYHAINANPLCGYGEWYDGRSCTFQNMGSYFPDFAMRTNPSTVFINGSNDSQFVYISVPAVKLYTDKAKFTASVPPPSTGTITLTLLNRTTGATQDSLTTYPDSLKLRIKTSGGVTSGPYNITVTGKGSNGTPVHVRTITLNVNPVGITLNNNQIPKEFSLYQNYPNPFNPTTNIRFDVPKAGSVKITVYDLQGKMVNIIVNGHYNPGKYTLSFNGDNYSSGIYFYRIETDEFSDVRKMILVK